MPTTDQHATLRDRHLLDGGDGSAGPAKSFDHSLRRARAIKVSRGRVVSLWLLGKGCRPGRGLSLSLWFLGGLPPEHRARSIARGKLCSGAVSKTVPVRKGSASSQHHREAACDAIWSGANRSLPRTDFLLTVVVLTRGVLCRSERSFSARPDGS